jgi:hypothetical protein
MKRRYGSRFGLARFRDSVAPVKRSIANHRRQGSWDPDLCWIIW